jgi:hypothetical protein
MSGGHSTAAAAHQTCQPVSVLLRAGRVLLRARGVLLRAGRVLLRARGVLLRARLGLVLRV